MLYLVFYKIKAKNYLVMKAQHWFLPQHCSNTVTSSTKVSESLYIGGLQLHRAMSLTLCASPPSRIVNEIITGWGVAPKPPLH